MHIMYFDNIYLPFPPLPPPQLLLIILVFSHVITSLKNLRVQLVPPGMDPGVGHTKHGQSTRDHTLEES